MRNIREHPITQEEMIETLERLKQRELASDAIGSIDAVVLAQAIEIVRHRDWYCVPISDDGRYVFIDGCGMLRIDYKHELDRKERADDT